MKVTPWVAFAGLAGLLFVAVDGADASPPDRLAAEPTADRFVAPTLEVPDPAPMQAQCGDGRCEPPEDCSSCSSDCGECCGDGHCGYGEDCRSCPRDCGGCCGDGRCAPPEDCRSCPSDCGGC